MKINVVTSHGFCLGVDRAVNLAKETAKKYPNKTYLLGEIVHNSFVVSDLENNFNIKTVNCLDEIPLNSVVIFRAHGASPELYLKAIEKGLIIVDATCPIVLQSHKTINKLAKEKCKIIYLASDYNHDEAIACRDQSPEFVSLVTIKDLDNLVIDDPKNTFFLTQTTLSVLETRKVTEKLLQRYPELNIMPHICFATTERQDSILRFSGESDVVIIVGSKNSSNSLRLLETAKLQNKNSYIVESELDLNPSWFENIESIAISSGASTPENILENVINKINSYNLKT